MATSISVRCAHSLSEVLGTLQSTRARWLTSEHVQVDRLDFNGGRVVSSCGEVVELNEVDNVDEGEHAGEAIIGGVVQGCRDDAWRREGDECRAIPGARMTGQ